MLPRATVEAYAIITICTPREAKYLLEHLLDMALSLSLVSVYMHCVYWKRGRRGGGVGRGRGGGRGGGVGRGGEGKGEGKGGGVGEGGGSVNVCGEGGGKLLESGNCLLHNLYSLVCMVC